MYSVNDCKECISNLLLLLLFLLFLLRELLTVAPFWFVALICFFFQFILTKSTTTKIYIVLFTCAVTRTVHLERVFDNSTESFLKSFQRFTNRRGIPSIIYSDNAT